jgi:hypothetical protein
MKPKQNKKEEVIETPEVAGTPEVAKEVEVKDYSAYADMAATPKVVERRSFDSLTLSGTVETEVVGDGVEKRKPATFFKSYQTRPKMADGKTESEKLNAPVTIVPIKYRTIMQQTGGSKGELIVLKSTEFNGNPNDKVLIFKYGSKDEQGKQKIEATYGPMTAMEARQTFKNAEGKGVLKDKAHVYSLHNGGLVRVGIKGTGLWEMESELKNGKTDASRTPHQYLKDYFSKFAMNEPYFLFEMKVDAVYRDHLANKYYRPTFEKGARISAEVEVEVLKHLEDLHKYFTEQDKATAEYVASGTAPTVVVSHEEDDELDENGNPKF